MKPKRRYVRATAEYVDGTRVRYTWSCGHYRTEDLNGKHRPLARRIPGVAGVKFMAHYWRDGVNVEPCPTCTRTNR